MPFDLKLPLHLDTGYERGIAIVDANHETVAAVWMPNVRLGRDVLQHRAEVIVAALTADQEEQDD